MKNYIWHCWVANKPRFMAMSVLLFPNISFISTWVLFTQAGTKPAKVSQVLITLFSFNIIPSSLRNRSNQEDLNFYWNRPCPCCEWRTAPRTFLLTALSLEDRPQEQNTSLSSKPYAINLRRCAYAAVPKSESLH